MKVPREKKKNNVESKALTNIPTTEQQQLLLEKLVRNEETHVKVMTVAAAHMFDEMADEFRTVLDQEGVKRWEFKAQITGIRKIRPGLEQIVKRNMRANITDVVIEGAEGTRTTLGTGFGLTNDEAVQFASKYTSALAGEIAGNSIDTVRDIITDGIKQGRAVKDTRILLEEKFTDWSASRAEMVARTETLRAANMGSLEILRKGGVAYKQFIAAPDACSACLALADQVNALPEPYMAKGDSVTLEGGETIVNNYMHMPAPPIHPRCRCTIGGIPGDLVQEETATVKKVGKRSANTDDLMEKFTQLDPAREFTHLRFPTHNMGLARAVENGSVEMTMRRYGDTMSIFLRDSGTVLPTAENWAGKVGHLAYGDTYTWLTSTAREAGRITIRSLANEAGSIVSLTGKSNLSGITSPLIEFGSATETANRVGWTARLASLGEKYPDPMKLVAQVGDEPLEDTTTAVAQTGHKGSRRKINFSTKYSHEELNDMFGKARRDGYSTIPDADGVATHEFGHVVDNYLQNKGIDTSDLRLSDDYTLPSEHAISDYATRNEREYFAETFTAFEHGGDPSRYDIQAITKMLIQGGLLQ